MFKNKSLKFIKDNKERFLKQTKVEGYRYVPIENFLKSKKMSYILYIYLQKISFRIEGNTERYILKNNLNYKKIAEELNMDRRTVSKYIKNFIELGLIKIEKDFMEQEFLVLVILNKIDYILINTYTLNYFSNLKEYIIRTFLFHKYCQMHYNNYYCTLNQIAKQIGYSSTNLNKIIEANNYLEEEVKFIKREYYNSSDNKTVIHYLKGKNSDF